MASDGPGSRGGLLVDVGGPVLVGVLLLFKLQAAIGPVAGAQDRCGEQRGEQRTGQDGDLDVLVAFTADPEGELADEQRDGEADPGEQGEPQDVDPRAGRRSRLARVNRATR